MPSLGIVVCTAPAQQTRRGHPVPVESSLLHASAMLSKTNGLVEYVPGTIRTEISHRNLGEIHLLNRISFTGSDAWGCPMRFFIITLCSVFHEITRRDASGTGNVDDIANRIHSSTETHLGYVFFDFRNHGFKKYGIDPKVFLEKGLSDEFLLTITSVTSDNTPNNCLSSGHAARHRVHRLPSFSATTRSRILLTVLKFSGTMSVREIDFPKRSWINLTTPSISTESRMLSSRRGVSGVSSSPSPSR